MIQNKSRYGPVFAMSAIGWVVSESSYAVYVPCVDMHKIYLTYGCVVIHDHSWNYNFYTKSFVIYQFLKYNEIPLAILFLMYNWNI